MLSLARELDGGRCIPGGPSDLYVFVSKIVQVVLRKADCEGWCSNLGRPRDE